MNVMKKILLFVLLSSVFILTSCLGGDSEPIAGNYNVISKLEYDGYEYTFKTPGQKPMSITPTESSVNNWENLNGGFSLASLRRQITAVSYSWNPDLLQFPAGATEYKGVSLTNVLPLDAATLVVRSSDVGSEKDSVATHPIISVNPSNGYYTYKPYFYDDSRQDIIIPVNYYYPYNTQATSVSVTLVYYPDDPLTISDKANNILRLHLNYRVRGVEEFSTQYTSLELSSYLMNGVVAYFKAYRLDDKILTAWGGPAPANVNIVVSENSYSTKLDDQQTEKGKVYPVLTYEEFVAETE